MKRIGGLVFVACLLVTIVAPWAAADPVQWPANGHWYEEVTSTRGTWEQAVQTAQGMSWMGAAGHLATITTQEEDDFLASFVFEEPAWLAGYQDPQSSPPADDWHWLTGEGWSYARWRSGEPNDYYGAGSESCLEWSSAGWNDVRCEEGKAFLVEYEGVASTTTTSTSSSSSSSTTSTSSTSTTTSTTSTSSSSSTSSFPSTSPPTTTTLPAGGCDGIPDGATFSSLICRVQALRDRTNGESGLGAFQPKLVKSLDTALGRLGDARTRCGESNLKKARKRLQQAGKALAQYAHRLRGLPARKKLDDALRQDFLAAGQAITPDVATLRGTVVCPSDAAS